MPQQPAPCPNCGQCMTRYRTDRTPVGEREIELQWSICPSCRHVRLDQWDWVDVPATRGSLESHEERD
jgi:hypothetical protein